MSSLNKRMLLIVLFLAVMAGSAWMGYQGIGAVEEPKLISRHFNQENTDLVDNGVFQSSEMNFWQGAVENAEGKNLEKYYENRAYPGAPPKIPHPSVGVEGIGEKTCLQCHENGGYVEKFKAFAPVTPHPEYISCRQCHVDSNTKDEFVGTNWVKMMPPVLNNKALISSPPVIPHGLQLRENCLACHGGENTPQPLKVNHPERFNCLQCHVLGNSKSVAIPKDSSHHNAFFRKPK